MIFNLHLRRRSVVQRCANSCGKNLRHLARCQILIREIFGQLLRCLSVRLLVSIGMCCCTNGIKQLHGMAQTLVALAMEKPRFMRFRVVFPIVIVWLYPRATTRLWQQTAQFFSTTCYPTPRPFTSV